MDWGRAEIQDAGARLGGRDLVGPDDLPRLFAGATWCVDQSEEALGDLRVLHGWLGPQGPGAALSFPVRVPIDPRWTAFELRLRDRGRYVRTSVRPLRDRHGDLTLRPPLPGPDCRVYGFLPYVALPERVGRDVALEAWLLDGDDPTEEALWPLPVPDAGARLYDNPLTAIALACLSAAAAGRPRSAGPALVPSRAGAIEDALVARFGLDPVGRSVLGALLEDLAPEAHRMVAARLRARVAPAGHAGLLALLRALAGPTPEEARWIESLASRLGDPALPPPRTPPPDPALAALGLPLGATWEEVRAAYRQAAARCHPDRVSAERQAAAHEEMKRINAAYAELTKRMRPG